MEKQEKIDQKDQLREKLIKFKFIKFNKKSTNFIIYHLKQLEQDLQNLQSLYISGCKPLHPLNLQKCINLSVLNVCGRIINYEDLNTAIKTIPNLQELAIADCQQIKQFNFQNCKNLRILKLGSTCVNDEQIDKISGFYQNLEELFLNNCQKILDLCSLFNLKSIKKLNLSHSTIATDQKISMLCKSIQKLQQLNLSDAKLIKELRLSNFKIKKLFLRNTQLENACLQGLQKLQKLDLSDNKKLKYIQLKELTSLKDLNIKNSFIQSLELISTPNLESLYLRSCKHLRDLTLTNCQSIYELDLSYLKRLNTINLEGMKSLNELKLKQCEKINKLSIKNCNLLKKLKPNNLSISIIQLQLLQQLQQFQIQNMAKLQKLKIKDCLKLNRIRAPFTNLKQVVIQSLLNLELVCFEGKFLDVLKLNNCPNIKILNLSSTLITDDIINYVFKQIPFVEQIYLRNCSNLRFININDKTHLKKIDLSSSFVQKLNLKSLKSLDTLNLEKCRRLTNDFNILDCSSLKKLNLSETCINNVILGRIQQSLANLQQLNLHSCMFLTHLNLQKGNKLKQLDISKCTFGDEVIKQLQNGMCQQLQVLNLLQNTSITSIQFKNIKYLKHVILNNSFVKNLELQKIQKLQILDLKACTKLNNIHIIQCKQLKSLSLQNNFIESLELRNNLNLQQINLLANKYRLIHIEIIQCPKLNSFQLSQTSIPITLLSKLRQVDFQNLIKLTLQDCKLTSLQGVANLNFNHLRTLDLSKNRIINLKALQKRITIADTLNLSQTMVRDLSLNRAKTDLKRIIVRNVFTNLQLNLYKLTTNKLQSIQFSYKLYSSMPQKQRKMLKKRFLKLGYI